MQPRPSWKSPVAKDGFELLILHPPSPECRDYRGVPLCPGSDTFQVVFRAWWSLLL